MNALMFGCIVEDIRLGEGPNLQMFAREQKNLAEFRSFTATMQDTGGRKQNEHPYWKGVWTEHLGTIRLCMAVQTHTSPLSPVLAHLDYFLYGTMESTVYEKPVNSEMNLMERISISAAMITESLAICENVHQSISHRCHALIRNNGSKSEHFLWCL